MLYFIFTAFLTLVILSAFIIPRILIVAFRKWLFDMPNDRKVYTGVVPCLGGMPFAPTILFSLAFFTGFRYLLSYYVMMNLFQPWKIVSRQR